MTQPPVPPVPPDTTPPTPAAAPAAAPARSEWTQRVIDGYTFTEPSIELGVLMEDGVPVPDAKVRGSRCRC